MINISLLKYIVSCECTKSPLTLRKNQSFLMLGVIAIQSVDYVKKATCYNFFIEAIIQ